MTTSGISQTGIQFNLVNQQMNANELKQQNQFKPDKGIDDAIKGTDSVQVTANIADKPAIEFDAINEEDAINLTELVAQDLSKQSFGMSIQGGTEALRTLI